MNGGLDRATMERLRRQRGNNAASSGGQNSKLAKLYLVIQLLPMVMMMVYYFLPQFLEKKDLFVFEQSSDYPYRKVTNENEVVYYVGNSFVDKYKKEGESELMKYEKEIEKKYLDYLYETCDENKQTKRQLENQMRNHKKGSVYYNYYQKELNKLNLQACDLYDEFKEVIN